jgi:hypothetical protein
LRYDGLNWEEFDEADGLADAVISFSRVGVALGCRKLRRFGSLGKNMN